MSLDKAYDPKKYEADIYTLWNQAKVFTPTQNNRDKSFSVVVPPPNANGDLHIGHALTLALEDIAVRHHRMRGYDALLLPGADHAGFETQAVYEKHLAKEGKSRFDFTREELYARIWDFVAQNRKVFETQIASLGAGVDWSRLTFTLDQKVIDRAYKTFKKMFDEGLIYRGERLVNYCTHHRTGFADIEVVYEDAKMPLYYMKYGPFTLATTRPETKFGDTGVAVHPEDKRYKQWVGKTVTVDGVNGQFEVRVVADEMVDPDFGTGVVKITPAHSFDDWEVAQRHNLPPVRVINHDGKMNHHAGQFARLTVLEAREAVVKALKERGLLLKTDNNYATRVGKCYKCGTIIEPMLMEQWFIDMQPLAEAAVKALEQGKIKFYPEGKRAQLITYLQGLRDWNISRQIAWGIPIPAFQNVDDSDDWIFDERVDQETIVVGGQTYRRDPDVFDTWFSSGQWPFITLDYPDGADFKRFYPLSVMETGTDILMPWVSRMIMLGLYITGEVPFEKVYLHGLVLDEHGAKMSKSKGNVVNPIELVEQYGADALRMGLITGQTPGNNQPFTTAKVVGARNFCNKLWNIARFAEPQVAGKLVDTPQPVSMADHWILTKLQHSTDEIGALLQDYRFSEAYDLVYHLVWDDVADWYVEAVKRAGDSQTLAYVLRQVLTLTHPFAPFVTEAIWQNLGWGKHGLLAAEQITSVKAGNESQVADFETTKQIVEGTRAVTTALGLQKGRLQHRDDKLLTENAELITRLAQVASLEQTDKPDGLLISSGKHQVWLNVEPDLIKKHLRKLTEQQAVQAELVKQLQARLKNKAYLAKAPAKLVSESRGQLEEAKIELERLKTDLERFKKL